MPRSYSPAEWARRLDELMQRVLARPSDFHRSIVVWARWRARWLTQDARREGGLNLYHLAAETAARVKFLRAAADLMPRPAAKEERHGADEGSPALPQVVE
jgi:hypothetical protein